MPSESITSSWGLLVKVFKIVFFIDRSESRISRGQYWIGNGMLALFESCSALLRFALGDSVVMSGVSTILSAGLGILWLSLMTKRLRDLNMSAWRITPLVVFYLTFFVGFIMFLGPIFSGGELDFDFLQNILSGTYGTIGIAIYGIIGLTALIIAFRLSLSASVNENNRFGPDPLRNITVTNPSYWLIVIVFFLLSMFVDAFSDVETTLTPEEQQQLEQYMDDFDTDGGSGDVEYNANEGGLIGRLSSIQDRAQDVARIGDIEMISSALEIYNLDEDTYPVYETFVQTDELSGFLVDYLPSMPITDGYLSYYKSLEQGTGFVLMVELSSEGENANFFGSQSDLDNKSLQEIQDMINNPVKTDGKNRYVVVNG